MSKVVINGNVVDESEAVVSLLDRNVQLGMNVFETMVALDGEIEGFDLHINRLKKGMERLLLDGDDLSEASLKGEIAELLEANDLANQCARVRITVLDGVRMIQASEAEQPAETCAAVVSDYVLNERSATVGIKCGSYAPNMIALKESGEDEVIFLNSVGEVAESAMANVFLVSDGVLFTPRLESGCLPGVTRDLIIRRVRATGMEVRECAVMLEDLLDADEVFLTNSVIGVCGVERLGDVVISEGLGALSGQVKKIYKAGEVGDDGNE